MFAAITAAEIGCDVTLFEKNDILGKKLLITGKGRCNVTNNSDVQNIMMNIPVNSKFLYSALNGFDAYDTMHFFENCGVKLKTERGNRVFPQSDKSSDIVNALILQLKNRGVKVINESVSRIISKDGKIRAIETKNKIYDFESAIVCTGGLSYPRTGSDGDGYKFARQLGHSITKLKPSLVPLETKEKWCRDISGLSLKNINFRITENDKIVFEEFGEMLFTHFGVSGPVVLSASSRMNSPKNHRYIAHIDLKPGLSREKLNQRILRDFSENINKDFKNSLSELLPNKLIPVIIHLSGINSERKVNQITREERDKLTILLKDLCFEISSFRPIDEAIITSGGVSVKEINPKTMESKIINGLYFAGEIIDVDAYTGGYNLQIAFSTAYLAGKAQRD